MTWCNCPAKSDKFCKRCPNKDGDGNVTLSGMKFVIGVDILDKSGFSITHVDTGVRVMTRDNIPYLISSTVDFIKLKGKQAFLEHIKKLKC